MINQQMIRIFFLSIGYRTLFFSVPINKKAGGQD